MYTPISIQHKKNFIQWFLRHYTLKRHEANWLLNFLVKKDNLLSKVSFVNDAKFCPRGIIISSDCSDEVPFLFYKQHLITTDIDKFFHDIRLNEDEHIYIQLNFKNATQSPYYVGVLEENPFTPVGTKRQLEDKRISNDLLNNLIRKNQLKKLKEAIDQSLDEKDETRFNELVEQFQKLNNF